MNDLLNHDDEPLVAQAREALGRGALPSERVFAAIHAEAVLQAGLRRGRSARVRSLWYRGFAAVGGLAAAAALIVMAWRPESPQVEAAPERVPATVAIGEETLSHDILALMALVEGATDDFDGSAAIETLLRLQESPGGFESAHAMYALF